MRGLLVAMALIAGVAASRAQSIPAPPAGAAACTGCHAGSGTALPTLDGLQAADISAAMTAFRDGTREATVMDRLAKGFSSAETDAIAGWFAARGRKP